MKTLKIIGTMMLVAALVLSFSVVGRIEYEEDGFVAGEVDKEEMTTSEELLSQIGVIIALYACGGGIRLIADEIKKKQSVDV